MDPLDVSGERLVGAEDEVAVAALVGEGVWEVLGLNVVPGVAGGGAAEHGAHPAPEPPINPRHVRVKILRFCYQS